MAGRAAPTALQNHINIMEAAEDEAAKKDKATTAEEEAVFRKCRERYKQIADDINRLMYRKKEDRAPNAALMDWHGDGRAGL